MPQEGKMLLECNGGRIEEGQSKVRPRCSCQCSEVWRGRKERSCTIFCLWFRVRGYSHFPGVCLSALILRDSPEYIPPHDAAVPSEPSARLSD